MKRIVDFVIYVRYILFQCISLSNNDFRMLIFFIFGFAKNLVNSEDVFCLNRNNHWCHFFVIKTHTWFLQTEFCWHKKSKFSVSALVSSFFQKSVCYGEQLRSFNYVTFEEGMQMYNDFHMFLPVALVRIHAYVDAYDDCWGQKQMCCVERLDQVEDTICYLIFDAVLNLHQLKIPIYYQNVYDCPSCHLLDMIHFVTKIKTQKLLGLENFWHKHHCRLHRAIKSKNFNYGNQFSEAKDLWEINLPALMQVVYLELCPSLLSDVVYTDVVKKDLDWVLHFFVFPNR